MRPCGCTCSAGLAAVGGDFGGGDFMLCDIEADFFDEVVGAEDFMPFEEVEGVYL